MLSKHKTAKRTKRGQLYGEQVVSILREVGGFGLAPEIEELLVGRLVSNYVEPSKWFEFIIDHPTIANWRMKGERDGTVRLADYAYTTTEARTAREAAVNEALRAVRPG